MKVIFDIDGTLTDYRTFVKENALPFFVKKYGMKIINDNELEIEDILGMQTFFIEKYSCTEEEAIKMTKKTLNEFWVGMEYVKYTLLYPFRNGAASLIYKLRKAGYEIEIYTSRDKTTQNNWIGKVARCLTYMQFIRNGVFLPVSCFHFYSSDEEKRAEIIKCTPVCVFEDKKENVKTLMQKGISVFCVEEAYNTDVINGKSCIKLADFTDKMIEKKIEEFAGKRESEYCLRIARSQRKFNKISFVTSFIMAYFQPLVLHEKNILRKKESVLYVSNHRSTLDPVILTALLRKNIHWAALQRFFDGKDSIFNNSKNPVLCKITAELFQGLEYFPIERKRDNKNANNFTSVKDMCYFLKLGECVGIFPEGTTKRPEDQEFGEFDSSFILLAKNSNAWIQPVTVLWIKELEIRNKVILNFGKAFQVDKGMSQEEMMRMFIKVQERSMRENKRVREKLKRKK